MRCSLVAGLHRKSIYGPPPPFLSGVINLVIITIMVIIIVIITIITIAIIIVIILIILSPHQ